MWKMTQNLLPINSHGSAISAEIAMIEYTLECRGYHSAPRRISNAIARVLVMATCLITKGRKQPKDYSPR